MQNKHLGETKNAGYGKAIPPIKNHVMIWFLYMGATSLMAEDFWSFYQKRNWCNNKGKIIKDWKMRAWEWLWSGV